MGRITELARLQTNSILVWGILWLCPCRHNVSGYLFIKLSTANTPTCKNFLAQQIPSDLSLRQIIIRAGIHFRAVSQIMVYKKAINIPQYVRQEWTIGKIMNLMSTDSQRLNNFIWSVHYLWAAPLEIVVSMTLLIIFMGPISLSALGIMLILAFAQGKLMEVMSSLTVRILRQTDKRVALLNEILQGIRIIKFYAWESSFQDLIGIVRGEELRLVFKTSMFGMLNSIILQGYHTIVAVITFLLYSLVKKEMLTTSVAFSSLSLFNMLRFPIMDLPATIMLLVSARTSMERLEDFFDCEELPEKRSLADPSTPVGGISVRDEEFRFDPDSKRIDLFVRRVIINPGEFLLCIGGVGSGKSSFINALLGELVSNHGYRKYCCGKIAYSAQTAWIINATIKENIVFGRPFDQERYDKVIFAAGLTRDLEILGSRDQTEIGERGINLSGGQKQRVSIARAVYGDADVYIFDDPLSALDAEVGKHVFNECFMTLLKNKTKVVVTHHVHYAEKVDKIALMHVNYSTTSENNFDESPKLVVKEFGTFDDLIKEKTEFSKLYDKFKREKVHGPKEEKIGSSTEEKIADSDLKPAAESEKGEKKGELVEEEYRQKGDVSLEVYFSYFKAAGFLSLPLLLLISAISRAGMIGSDLWLSYWSSGKGDHEAMYYITGYGIISAVSLLLIFTATLCSSVMGYLAAKSIHFNMLACLLRAPVSFYDATPLGRIINRFSRDIDTIDSTLPRTTYLYIAFSLQALGMFAVICLGTYWFALAMVPVIVLFIALQICYRKSSRELKRIDSISKSPIFAQFSESLGGLSTIRAFNVEDDFIKRSRERIDTNNRVFVLLNLINRWIGIRLDSTGALILLIAAMLMALTVKTTSSGLIGLILSYSLSLTGALNWLVRTNVDLEMQMNSVERTQEYTKIESEGERSEGENRLIPSREWPTKGEIQFENACARYRPGLPLILNSVTVHIKSGERVGICGRTGSGKSSLMNALFRMIELSSGRILIDNVDIAQISLTDLRSRITIIPQDPVMFSGTVRTNLDPFEKYDDDLLWKALEAVEMKSVVSSLEGGLLSTVTENGDNFSVGQRQLFCLARAVLRDAKVLVCDEATASVDLQTDELIQQMIRRQFQHCTILTIAHRVETIRDYDKILGLADGQVVEFDTPENLLANPKSLFASLVRQNTTAAS
jgi:ABC-type multidrug transport system fused ATPase/permease subunit